MVIVFVERNPTHSLNYLAHILLSGSDMRVAVGNFIGDGVKGRIPETYSKEIYTGLRLHRFIDSMADTHPVNQVGRESMYPTFGHYAGVAQDMFHDHFLALHWDDYAELSIEVHLNSFYATADEHIAIFPEHQRQFLEGVRAGNWLINYRDVDGMGRAFGGLSKRIKRDNPLAQGGEYLKENYSSLESCFKSFFPLLLAESNQELERLLNIP